MSRPIVITAAEAERDQRKAAGALAARGLRAGDRVAIVATGSAAYLAVALGALRTGIVPVLLNPDLAEAEHTSLLADADAALVLTDRDLPALVNGPPVELAPAPLARPMLYTSGTTGAPKGVWTGVLDEDAAQALVAEERAIWHFDADDTHLIVSALYHSAPLRFAAGTLAAGGSVVLTGRFDAARVAEAIVETRPTTTFVAPAHLHRLFALADPPPLDSFRLIAHAGAPCARSLKQRTIDACRLGTVWEFYGSTEGQFTVCGPDEWAGRPDTVGRARPGRRLSTDSDGTIWCEVPDYARFQYWRDAAKTTAAWRGQAFTVGDLGRLDDDGYLYLDGRRDDLVISGGMNVYPLEVERALLEHPAVADVAVFGVTDERWGHRVCAAVVVEDGREAPLDELTDWLSHRLAGYKRPKELISVDAIPVSSTGKVRRAELASEFGLT